MIVEQGLAIADHKEANVAIEVGTSILANDSNSIKIGTSYTEIAMFNGK